MSTQSNNSKKMGKTQAREQFAPLVESLAQSGGIVEVTDYGKVAAVMLSYKDYLSLVARAQLTPSPSRQLAGSAVLLRDLDEASEEISKSLRESIQRTSEEL